MQIITIQKGFEAFECKFEQFQKDLKHSSTNSNHLNASFNYSEGFQSILMQIITIRKLFEAFDYKFKPF